MRTFITPRIVFALLIVVTLPVFAWGPKTQRTIVGTATSVLSKQGVVQLNKLANDIQQGVRTDQAGRSALYSGLVSGAERAVEAEMALLETVKSAKIDPYFAYRLGVLGGLVAQTTAPLADRPSVYRDKYYLDVESHLDGIPLELSPRKPVDPESYFLRVKRLAGVREDMILKDYQEGLGFGGVARASLPDDFTRSVDAVADVWNAVLLGKAVHATVSDAQVRDYLLGAFAYYAKQKNEMQIDATYRRLAQLTTKTTDMSKEIGDIFYETQLYDRAIGEYEEVLAARPQDKEVLAKITAYYIKIGDEALKTDRLDLAFKAYTNAANMDPLDASAASKRLEAKTLLENRNARLSDAQRRIEDAKNMEERAEQSAARHNYAEALALLAKAEENYLSISEEFAVEFQAAASGLADVSAKMDELKGRFIENAQNLSGTTFEYEMQRFAAVAAPALDEKALKKLAEAQLEAALDSLKRDYEGAFHVR